MLQDEEEEEREQQERELATGESTVVLGQKRQTLPSRKTVSSEKAVSEIDKIYVIYDIIKTLVSHYIYLCQAELILECLEITKEYEEELSKVTSANGVPALPLLVQGYNCANIEDFLLETFKRVRAR